MDDKLQYRVSELERMLKIISNFLIFIKEKKSKHKSTLGISSVEIMEWSNDHSGS